MTNSERRISRQRAFLPAPGEARADWAIFSQLGKRMGFSGFDFRSRRCVSRTCRAVGVRERRRARLRSWRPRRSFGRGIRRFFADAMADPRGRALRSRAAVRRRRLLHARSARAFRRAGTAGAENQDFYALSAALNTGRVRDQWHTMTRTGASPRLARHLSEPFIEINDADARQFGVKDGGFAESRQFGEPASCA